MRLYSRIAWPCGAHYKLRLFKHVCLDSLGEQRRRDHTRARHVRSRQERADQGQQQIIARPTGLGVVSFGVVSTRSRAGFYYPWFPEAWNQQGINPFTHYTPSLGVCDTSLCATDAGQVQAMHHGFLRAVRASWWGQGSRTDGRVSTLLQAAAPRGFQWARSFEAEGNAVGGVHGSAQPNDCRALLRSRMQSTTDYESITKLPPRQRQACAPRLRRSDRRLRETAARRSEANTLGFYLNLKVFSGYDGVVRFATR